MFLEIVDTKMDIYAVERFCDRWIEKAETYQYGDLEDLFDRFFTLFVAYNRFYSTAGEIYRASLDSKRRLMLRGDQREATIMMAQLIGQRRFSTVINKNPVIAYYCENIAELLKNRQFFLHSARETKAPDFLRDARLAEGLSKHRLLEVLQCLYQIRCNIFHGEKELAPRQANLLAPAIGLLEVVVRLSREALREIAYNI